MRTLARQNALIVEQNSPSKTNTPSVLSAGIERNKVIWRFSDARPGHDAQSKGLVLALSKRIGCDHHDILTPLPFASFAWSLLKKFPPAINLPDPDLLVGAGHATHIPMLMARHVRGGKALVLMKPSLPTAFFDICLIPEHDKFKAADNILTTTGPLNLLSPSKQLSSSQGLILIGGESKHFVWDNERLRGHLAAILKNTSNNWIIADSPRTPKSTRALLQKFISDKVRYLPFADESGSGVVELLQSAGTVWVSEDSMSMIYEALSTGAAVGILPVTKTNKSRLADVAESLANKKLLTLFDDWLSNKILLPPATTLNESARCADVLINRLGWVSADTS
ncbi:MAG: mitochondrial fission protein ELM1 [Planctomycetota bacterium]